MSYSIKQVAAMLGISPQTLRFYERYGIDAGTRAAGEGYRRYSHAGVDELMSIRKYRNCGFTLARASKALNSQNPDTVAAMLHDQAHALEKEATLKMLFAQKMKALCADIRARDQTKEAVCVEPLLCVNVTGEERQLAPEELSLLADWVQWMPLAQWTLFISPDLTRYFYGFAMEEKAAKLIGIQPGARCFTLPTLRCVQQALCWYPQETPLFSAALPALRTLVCKYGQPAHDIQIQTLCNCKQREKIVSYGFIFFPAA